MTISPRIRELAAQPYLRPGATDLDLGYVIAIFDARTLIALEEAIAANPGKPVRVGHMGSVPHLMKP